MEGKANNFRRWLLIGAAVTVAFIGVPLVMTWPSIFVSKGRELTGANIDLREIIRFDRERGGFAAAVYRVADGSADALNADQQSLRRYPMWSAAVFDGYKRVR
jgi:hypothetical protein